ncbi:MAG: hypothetical protein ABIP74_03135 [Candidatus Saccharimonas sp.]
MSADLADTIGSSVIIIGWVLGAVFLIIALFKKAEHKEGGEYFAFAAVSPIVCWFVGLSISQIAKFGFIDGMLGIFGGLLILGALIGFIAWIFNAT